MARGRGNGAAVIDTDATEPVDAAEALAQTGEGPSIEDLAERQEAPEMRYAQVLVNVTEAAMHPGSDPITVWYPDGETRLSADQALHLSLHLRTAYDLVEYHETMSGRGKGNAPVPARGGVVQ